MLFVVLKFFPHKSMSLPLGDVVNIKCYLFTPNVEVFVLFELNNVVCICFNPFYSDNAK